ASTVQDFTLSPSSRTVHAPHDVVSHPMLVPVRPAFSRMKWTSSCRGSTSCVCSRPLTVIVTFTAVPSLLGLPDGRPHAFGRGRHVDMTDVEVGQGVDDRVLHRGCRPDTAGLVDALGAEG